MAIEVRGMAPCVEAYDMPTSIRFYRDVLGFKVVHTSPNLGGEDRFHWVLLRLGDVELMLNSAYECDDERPAVPDPERAAAHKDVCFFFGCPQVDAAYEDLRSKGLAVREPSVAPYGMKQLSLSDPDGYGLCFQWPVKE